MKKFVYGTVILTLFFFSVYAFGQENVSMSDQRYVVDEVIVKFKPEINIKKSSGIKSMQDFASNENLIPQENIPAQNITVMKIEDGQSVMSVIQDIQNNPSVEYSQPNFIYTLETTDPNDPGFSNQRGLKNIGQNGGTSGSDIQRNEAMDIWSGYNDQNRTGTTVAVIDVGVNINHEDLLGHIRNGINCVSYTSGSLGGCLGGYSFLSGVFSNDPNPDVGDWHGTHIAGIIGASMGNAKGIAGINPNVKIMGIKAGNTTDGLRTDDLIKAIDFAKYNGAKIINASRGSTGSTCSSLWGNLDSWDRLLYGAIRDFPGLFIAAAGNNATKHSDSFFVSPADYSINTSCRSGLDNIISVAATNAVDTIASFSDYGTSAILIAAPGTSILSTVYNNQYGYASGTSMAAPFVAAVASLARSMRPELTYVDIKNAIINQAESVSTLLEYVAGGKRLNAYTTLKYLSIDNIFQLMAYTDTGKNQQIFSGGYVSGDQIYFTRMPPQFTGSLSGYMISISGSTFTTGWVTTTGILLTGLAQEGQYTFSVYPVFTTNATGDMLSLIFSRDVTAPSSVTLIDPIDTNIVGYGIKRFSWSVASDTGAGIDHYLYTIYISGGVSSFLTGISSGTGADIARSTGNGYYNWQVQAIDKMGYSGESSVSSTFIVNIPQAFTFPSQSNKELSTSYQSDMVSISGLVTGSQVSILGGTYSINAAAFTTNTGTIISGDTIKIQLTSSASYSSQTTATLTIGGLTGTFSITTKSAPSGGGGGGGGGGGAGPTISTCTLSQLICTGGIYSIKLGVSCEGGDVGKSCSIVTGTVLSGKVQTGTIPKYTIFTPTNNGGFSAELIQAYNYAYNIGITSILTIQQANMTGTLIRKHLAKMISNFAIKQMNRVLNTGMICDFTDMNDENTEMKFYSKVACQLGLMGLDANGAQVSTFSPNNEVTRAQFGTVLSRTLRGNQYNGGEPFYIFHLNALQKAVIMKQIDTPENKELRGYVMLMLMRTTE